MLYKLVAGVAFQRHSYQNKYGVEKVQATNISIGNNGVLSLSLWEKGHLYNAYQWSAMLLAPEYREFVKSGEKGGKHTPLGL